LAGSFFLVAPGESKFIPVRGNPRWSTKNIPRLSAGEYFFWLLPRSRSLSPAGEIPAEHQNRENQQSVVIAGFSLFINALRRFQKELCGAKSVVDLRLFSA